MVQVGTTKDQGLYKKPSAAVHSGAFAAGTLPQYKTKKKVSSRSAGSSRSGIAFHVPDTKRFGNLCRLISQGKTKSHETLSVSRERSTTHPQPQMLITHGIEFEGGDRVIKAESHTNHLTYNVTQLITYLTQQNEKKKCEKDSS